MMYFCVKKYHPTHLFFSTSHLTVTGITSYFVKRERERQGVGGNLLKELNIFFYNIFNITAITD